MDVSRPTSPTPSTQDDIASAFIARELVPMMRLAVLLVGSKETAEDVVQDAFAAVDHRWNELERPGAYLRVSVVNGCRAVLRRRGVEERYLLSASVSPTAEMSVPLVELHHALATLTHRQRVVVVMRYFLDLPDDEIAEVLGCRPSSVRSIAQRSLKSLRKELT